MILESNKVTSKMIELGQLPFDTNMLMEFGIKQHLCGDLLKLLQSFSTFPSLFVDTMPTSSILI